MAEAFIAGILSNGIAKPQDILVSDPIEQRRQDLIQRYGVGASQSNLTVARGGDIVVLAVKPQTLHEVMNDMAGKFTEGQVVLSIVAGITIETITRGPQYDMVVRVMPNTPARYGVGMSVWTTSPQVDQKTKDVVRTILGTLGEELYVSKESYIDMASAISGSGPAYVFLFLESIIDAGVYMGLSREMARTLAVQTVLGSAIVAKETDLHTAQLRDMVTSPGGMTSEALLALEEGGFRASLWNAVNAAYEKARFLGTES